MFPITNNTALYSLENPLTNHQRLECFCHYRINLNNPSHFKHSSVTSQTLLGNPSKFGNVQNAKLFMLEMLYISIITMQYTRFSMQRGHSLIELSIKNYTSDSSNTAYQKIIHSSTTAVLSTLYFYSIWNKKALLIITATILTAHQKLWAIQLSFNKSHLTIFCSQM